MLSRSFRQFLVAATAVAAAMTPMTAVAAASPTVHVLPPGHPAATERTLLDLLAGSPDYLVYADGGQLAGGTHLSDAPAINEPSEHLFARTTAGKTIDLGHAPDNLDSQLSMVGPMLTGVTEKPDYGQLVSVRWWDVASGRSGTIPMPKGYTYQSAAPGGIVVSKGDELFVESTAGALTSLGTPMPGATYLSVTAATNGLIVQSDGAAAPSQHTPLSYLAWAQPGHFTALDSGTTLGLVCLALDTVVAGCVDEGTDGDGDATVDSLSLIPLDGSAPTVTSASPTDEDPAVVGDTMIWSSATGLQSVTLGNPTISTGPADLAASRRFITINGDDPYQDLHNFDRTMVSALGQAALVHSAGNEIALAASVEKTTTVVTAPASSTSVSDFDLTADRVVYADDQRRAHHTGQQYSTYSATLTRSGGRLKVSKPHLVHADTDYLHVGASKAVTVDASASAGEFTQLRVGYLHHVHTIMHVPFNAYLQVAGTRVMYAHNFNDGLASVYNAATGKTATVQTDSRCCDSDQGEFFGSAPALSGDAVSFVKTNGSVWRQQLGAAEPVRLSGPVAHARGGAVFAAGNYVAWSITHGTTAPYARSNGFRNVETMSKAVSVHHEIVGASSAGAITASRNLDFAQSVTAAFSLRMFSGKTLPLLSIRTIVGLPQVAGSTVAWVDGHGLLRIRQLH